MTTNKPQWLIIHHSAVSFLKNPNQWPATNTNHKQRFNFKARNGEYGGYHWEISAKGELHKFRDDDEIGAHCKEKEMNFKSIGICLDVNGDIEEPTKEQKQALLTFISEKQGKYQIPDKNVVPHRFFATGILPLTTPNWKTFTGKEPYKSCWGKLLPDDIISYLKQYAMPAEIPSIPTMEPWRQQIRDFAKQKQLLQDVDRFVQNPPDLDKILALVVNSNPELKTDYAAFLQLNQ